MGFQTASNTQVVYPKLDIADRSSVEELASRVRKKHGAVDVLINNAGVNLDDDYSAKNVKVTLDTNVRGTLRVSVVSLVVEFEVVRNEMGGFWCRSLSRSARFHLPRSIFRGHQFRSLHLQQVSCYQHFTRPES